MAWMQEHAFDYNKAAEALNLSPSTVVAVMNGAQPRKVIHNKLAGVIPSIEAMP